MQKTAFDIEGSQQRRPGAAQALDGLREAAAPAGSAARCPVSRVALRAGVPQGAPPRPRRRRDVGAGSSLVALWAWPDGIPDGVHARHRHPRQLVLGAAPRRRRRGGCGR